MIDLLKIKPIEAERIAYAEGFSMAAELFARIADLEIRCEELENENWTLGKTIEHMKLTKGFE